MKKLLIMLALCMAFSVVLVACESDPGNTDDSTAESTAAPGTEADSSTEETTAEGATTDEATTDEATTDEATTEEATTEEATTDEATTEEATTEEATTEEVTTEEVTTEEVTTEEVTTEEVTTEEVTTEPTTPPVDVIASLSWDALTTVHPTVGKTIISSGSEFLTWNGIANIDTNDSALSTYGWVAFFTETEGTVGYAFNGGEIVYDDSFTFTAEIGVQDYIHANCPGALSACRFQFDIPLEGLGAGTHSLCVYAKDPAGNVQLIREITLNIQQVEPIATVVPVDFNGSNGKITLEANGTYKFNIVNYGGKTMTITNTASCIVTASTYTLPAETVNGSSRVQEIPGPGAGWDSFELTIHNPTGEALEIELTIQ